MSKKLTFDYVKSKLTERGYILLSKEYNKASKKLIYQDREGYIYFQSYNGFDCNATSERFHKSNPYTIQNIKHWCILNNKPYILLSEDFHGNNKNLEWECLKCGESFYANWNNIYQGKGCGKCAKNRKLSYDEVKYFIEIESNSDCKLLSNEYFDVYQKLELECKCGNKFQINFTEFKNGNKRQCNRCGFLMIADSRRNDYDYVKNFIEVDSKSGCKLLSLGYIDNTTPLHIECNCGNDFYDTFAHFKAHNSSKSCEVCANKIKWDISKMQEWCSINAVGYKIIEVFIKKDKPSNNLFVKVKCPNINHPPYEVSWNSFYSRSSRCRQCFLENNTRENHANWKGGVTALSNYLRKNLSVWKTDSMIACNYKCILTGTSSINIHHLYGFNMIFEELMKEIYLPIHSTISDYTEDELKLIVEKCLEIHHKYPLGICLSKDIHVLFHKLYGKSNNTPEQFEEFKQRYLSGEFKQKEAS